MLKCSDAPKITYSGHINMLGNSFIYFMYFNTSSGRGGWEFMNTMFNWGLHVQSVVSLVVINLLLTQTQLSQDARGHIKPWTLPFKIDQIYIILSQ